MYIDAHESSLDARRTKLSLLCASKIKSLPKHPTHDAVFDNKYMKLSDAFVTAYTIDFSNILEALSFFVIFMRLSDSTSIFTDEIWAIIKALEEIKITPKYIVYTDSLS